MGFRSDPTWLISHFSYCLPILQRSWSTTISVTVRVDEKRDGDVSTPRSSTTKKGASNATSEGAQQHGQERKCGLGSKSRVSQQGADAAGDPGQARNKRCTGMLRRRSRKWQGKSEGQLRFTHSSRGNRNSVVLVLRSITGDFQTKARVLERRAQACSVSALCFERVALECVRMTTQTFGVVGRYDGRYPSSLEGAERQGQCVRANTSSWSSKEEVGVQGIDPPPRRRRERDQPTRVFGQEGRECGRNAIQSSV